MRKSAACILIFCLTYATGLQAGVLASFPGPAQQQDNGQQNYQQDPNQYNQDPNQYNQDYDQDYYQNNGYENYSPDQLDNLLAPIALYPDPLLAQVLPAATFVDQIDEASRYVRSYGQNGVDDQDWDVSVKAVAHYPAVLDMMADKIDWTTALGQAYVNQSTDVMISVQRLRRLASDQGNLVTNQQQQVIVQPSYIQIWPAQPQYVYVPVYNPAYVYYRRPSPGAFFITFGTGFIIGAWLNRDCDWGGRRVYYTGWNGGGWIGRSRGYVHIHNTVYVNNRYTNITINRTVVNRRVNYTNMNRYNSIHRNVNYNNLTRNNVIRDKRPVNNRPGNGNNRPGNGNNRPGTPGNNTRPGNPGNRPGNNNGNNGGNNGGNNNTRPAPGNNNGNTRPAPGNNDGSTRPAPGNNNGNTRPAPGNTTRPANPSGPTTRPAVQPTTPTNRLPNNTVIDRNIDRQSPSLDKYRGRDNPQTRPATPAPTPAPKPAVQPAVQPARPAPTARPAAQQPAAQPRAFNTRQTDFNANQASARGQQSRAQAAPKQQAAPRQQAAPAPKPAPAPRSNAAPAKNSGKPR